jgi:hypothetical protein
MPATVRLTCLAGTWAFLTLCTASASAGQESVLLPGGGGGFHGPSAVVPTVQDSGFEFCTWYLIKPMSFWGYLKVSFSTDYFRTLAQGESGSYTDSEQVSLTIRTQYLPSTTLTCNVDQAMVEYGLLYAPNGYSYTVNHSNPSCDGYPPQYSTPHATSPYWISEELWNTNAFIANSIYIGGTSYWAAVGQDLGYPQLQTPGGGDVGFYPSWSLAPNVSGEYIPASRTIVVNVVNFGGFDANQWSVVASHELGHAVGFDNAGTSDFTKTIMIPGWDGSGSLGAPRTLDKCGAVRLFPVDLT